RPGPRRCASRGRCAARSQGGTTCRSTLWHAALAGVAGRPGQGQRRFAAALIAASTMGHLPRHADSVPERGAMNCLAEAVGSPWTAKARGLRTALRAVAERLAGEGFEIDLHVIGLALTPEAERSFQGIGTFQSVSSAAELAEALGRAVELPAAPETLRVTVRLT